MLFKKKNIVATKRRKRVGEHALGAVGQGLLQKYRKEKARARQKSVVRSKERMRQFLKYLVDKTDRT